MSTKTGAYSGSGANPIPAKGSFMQDDKQDLGAQKQPECLDYAGGMSARKPRYPLQGD